MTVLAILALAAIDVSKGHGTYRGTGICVKDLWIELKPGDVVKWDWAADATHFHVIGRGNRNINIHADYMMSPIPPAGAPILFAKQGYEIVQMRDEGYLRAYQISQPNARGAVYISGSVFDGSKRDIAFFNSITFGQKAITNCNKFWGLKS